MLNHLSPAWIYRIGIQKDLIFFSQKTSIKKYCNVQHMPICKPWKVEAEKKIIIMFNSSVNSNYVIV